MTHFQPEECRGRDSDDFSGVPIERDFPPDRGRVAAQFALPEGIAHDYSGYAASAPVVVRYEKASSRRRDLERLKEVAAYPKAALHPDLALRCQIDLSAGPGEHATERLLPVPNLL